MEKGFKLCGYTTQTYGPKGLRTLYEEGSMKE